MNPYFFPAAKRAESRWWFQMCFIFSPFWGLIFFKWVESNHQLAICFVFGRKTSVNSITQSMRKCHTRGTCPSCRCVSHLLMASQPTSRNVPLAEIAGLMMGAYENPWVSLSKAGCQNLIKLRGSHNHLLRLIH